MHMPIFFIFVNSIISILINFQSIIHGNPIPYSKQIIEFQIEIKYMNSNNHISKFKEILDSYYYAKQEEEVVINISEHITPVTDAINIFHNNVSIFNLINNNIQPVITNTLMEFTYNNFIIIQGIII